jgi:ElaB/YqjD/DUF883 family membrane-anchored ribosome-binding protein
MAEQNGPSAQVEGTEKTPEEIQREIEDTREQLGDTAAALAAKADVKARAQERVNHLKQTITAKKDSFGSSSAGGDPGVGAQASSAITQVKTRAQENPIAAAAIAAFVGGFLSGRITKR